jgi:hypothetical protein
VFGDVSWFTLAGLAMRYQCEPISSLGYRDLEIAMAAIARAIARAFPGTQVEVETLKTIAIFCGVGLVVSLLLATYGLDLSYGFF